MTHSNVISTVASDALKGKTASRDEDEAACAIHPLLAQRRTFRAFSGARVEPDTLRALLYAARWAPSSMNQQPWSFIVATKQNKTEFDRLLSCLLEFNVVWAQHAPVLILSIAKLTFDANGEPNRHAFHDAGQAMAGLTFQANACGLNVCQMAGFDVVKAREMFAIPGNHEPVVAAAIGYPGEAASLPERLQRKQAAPQRRRPFRDFVFEGTFGNPLLWA
jgi:nitroreductase